MLLKNICVLVLWTKVASALEGLTANTTNTQDLIVGNGQILQWDVYMANPNVLS